MRFIKGFGRSRNIYKLKYNTAAQLSERSYSNNWSGWLRVFLFNSIDVKRGVPQESTIAKLSKLNCFESNKLKLNLRKTNLLVFLKISGALLHRGIGDQRLKFATSILSMTWVKNEFRSYLVDRKWCNYLYFP